MGVGRFLQEGSFVAKAFLVRTPPMVEDGLRNVLKHSLPELSIKKARKYLGDSGVSVNPDLLIHEGSAVADIKYKRNDGQWNRSDLYEIVASASAYAAKRAALVDFNVKREDSRPTVWFQQLAVAHLTWLANDGISPQLAESILVDQVRTWLTSTNQ